jgi:hypothetical protein
MKGDHLEDLGIDKRIILQEVLGRTNHLLPFDITWTTEEIISSILACIHCHRNMFIEPLPSNDKVDTHTDTGKVS